MLLNWLPQVQPIVNLSEHLYYFFMCFITLKIEDIVIFLTFDHLWKKKICC